MQIYGLKNCDSCRKACKALPQASLVDVRSQGVPDAVLKQAIRTFGASLVNTRSTTWRALDEQSRALPTEELLARHPAVMKRPLIADGDNLFLGWNAATQAALKI